MLEDSFADNLRQTGVVMKYEFRKYFHSKKIAIFSILMGAILFLEMVVPYIIGEGLDTDPTVLAYSMMSAVQLLIVLLASLFISGTIVSEFEDRTALILFTKPLRKESIFLGKVLAALVIGTLFILLYYAVVSAVSLHVASSVVPTISSSLGLALAYMVGTSGVAILISSSVKKFSTAAILTFVMLFMIFMMISHVMVANSIDPWFMLDAAGNEINASVMDAASNALRSAGVMLAWGLVAGTAGYLVFRRREL